MAQFSLQIMSDLHLETPASRPSYEDFDIEANCPNLALLGDIGNVSDPQLFHFLGRQLQHFELILYILGNHEAYGSTYPHARATLRSFEADVKQRRSRLPEIALGQFVFLDRDIFDCSENLTILGCTLFSDVRPEQRDSVVRFVSDFSEIDDWTVHSHNEAHQVDVSWLDAQISRYRYNEPHRTIVILTHYSPTSSKAANDARHMQDGSQVQSAFVTDLSKYSCWESPQVKLWAFGHTHHNCDFDDEQTGKRVFANQKGYRRAEAVDFDGTKVVTVKTSLIPQEIGSQPFVAGTRAEAKQKRCIVS